MKTVSAGLATHLAQRVTTLCTCWKITRDDGAVYGYTNHTADLNISSVLYKAASGFTASHIETSSQLNVDNLELTGALISAEITEADVTAGLWDFADVEIFQVNYTDLSQGTLKLRKGNLGELRTAGNMFVAELRGMLQKIQQNIAWTYEVACNADVFDARCGLSAASFSASSSVTAITSNSVFNAVSLAAQPTGYYAGGLLTWTSGLNDGLRMEVKAFTTGTGLIELFLPMPFDIGGGDTFDIQAGCDKSVATCLSKFNNVINFRGFPYIPGNDKISSGLGS
jgi:uncharacterized phage protein (TIGR02218 family)